MQKIKNSSIFTGLFEIFRYYRPVIALLLIGLGIRLSLAPFTSHPYDFASWVSVMERFFNLSISPFYAWKFGTFLNASFLFYYPLYLVFLQIAHVQNVLMLQLILKIPLILADMGIAIVLFSLAIKSGASLRKATLLMSFWIFNPFAIFVSAVHGQTDAFSTLFVILSVYFLQQKQFLKSFGSLLVGGMFKYYSLLLLPIFVLFSWKQTNKLTKIGGLILLILIPIANYAPVILDPVNRGLFFSGLSSSMEPTETSYPWSLWILPRLFGFSSSFPSSYATSILVVAYLSFLIIFVLYFIKRKAPLELRDVIKAYIAAITVFIAFTPVANPQFLLWILPLFLYFSFTMQKPQGYAFVTILWFFNLAALFTLFSPQVYVLNAVPNVFTMSDFFWPFVSPFDSIILKSIYSLLLLFALFRLLNWRLPVKQVQKELKEKLQNKTPLRLIKNCWRKFGRKSVFINGINLVTIVFFFSIVFYPAWAFAYFQHPSQTPVDLYRLNNIQYASAQLNISENSGFTSVRTQVKVDLASWLQASSAVYANSSLIIRVDGKTPENPPLLVFLNGDFVGQFIINSSGDAVVPLKGQFTPLFENDVLVTADRSTIKHVEQISIQVTLDIRPENPWWLNNVSLVYILAAFGVALLGGTFIFYAHLLKKSNSVRLSKFEES